ncbi:hypothetical protein [uncultured Methylobacterium sp.]|uniref:hypothetical protein n=1 Tax=uncultured Methylobacterium sp. TaxID=157278 RepID=UPI0035CA51F5
MSKINALCLALLACCLSACSSYPLPQDVSGFDTAAIIANVRCEARDAVRDAVIANLKTFKEPVYRDMTGPELAEALEYGRKPFSEIRIDDLKGKAYEPFKYYRNTQIAYDFSLKGDVSNTQGFDLALVRNFGLRKDTLGFKDSSERQRQVTRGFWAWDRFETVINIPNAYCDKAKIVNLVYSITGSMPIYDLISNYISANNLEILAKPKDAGNVRGTEEAPAIPQMGDIISFRTKLVGNMTPTFNYNPIGSGLLVSSLALTNENYREDTHMVTVTVSTAREAVIGRTRAGKAVKQQPTDDERLLTARASIDSQRERRFRDAVIDIGEGISRLSR